MLQPTTATTVSTDTKKIWKSVEEAIKEAGSAAVDFNATWSKLDELSADFVKNTGIGRERTIEMETSITQSATQILKFSEGILSYEDALKRSAEIVGDISRETSRSLVGNAKEIEGIAVAMEATNVPSATLVKNFKEAGFSLSAIPKEMQKVTDYTRSIGVNTAEVSKGVVENLKNLNLYNFDNGVQGLTKMAAQSALFGVNMGKIFSMSEELFNPEKAIEMAASLQRLGVSTSALLDPLALMDMGQNNPAELQNQIVEMTKQFTYFDEKNQKFQILPGAQRQMREIGKELGIGADELARMALGSSELNKKMSEIRFPTLDTGPMSEEQKQMIANMAELRDGKYSVMVEQKDAQGFKTGIMEEKAITELSPEDIKTLSESSKPKALEDIAKEQLTALNRIAGAVTSTATAPKAGMFGSAIGQAARGGVYRTESAFANTVGDLIKPDTFKKLTDDFTVMFKDYGAKMMSGDKKGAEKVGKEMEDRMTKEFFGGLEKMVKGGLSTLDVGKEELERILHAGNESAKNIKTQTTTQTKTQQQKVQEPKSVGSAMTSKDIIELSDKMSPNFTKLYEQIKGGGGNEAEISVTLSKIGEQLGKSGMDDKSIKYITDLVGDNAKLTQDQIKTLTNATKVTEKNETQQSQIQTQSQSQIQEPKSFGSAMTLKDIEELSNKMRPDFNKLYEQMNEGGSEDEISMTLSKIGEQLGKSGMDDKTMKEITDMLGDNAKLTKDQIKTLTDATKVTEKNEIQQPQIAQQTQTKETKTVVSGIKSKDIEELAKNIKPDYNNLKKQIGGDDTEINATLLKIGDKLGESGMDDKTIEMLTNKMSVDAKLSESQIKTLINATKVPEKNETRQLQTTDQSKEQTGIANMIKPEELKGLVDEMLPKFQNFAKQVESGNEVDAEKTGKDIELQLSKFGMDDKTMKMFTDMVSDSTTLTEEQIKTLAKSSQVTEKNETQQSQTAQQTQSQTETQTPKLSWMKQIDAFDKVTQGIAGETQTVTNSQVNDLNNQTVTATNNDQQQTNQSDYLIERILQAQPQTQIVEHKFDGTITIKVDAPPGVDTAYITKTVTDTVNKAFRGKEFMADNYGLTGGKISELKNSSGTDFA